VDAHLPPSLAIALNAAGHDAMHTRELPEKNLTRDRAINELSLKEQRVVVSKDTDFFYSLMLQGRPWKLLLIRTGNLRAKDLRALIERNLPSIVAALQSHSLVEIDRQSVNPIR
jgi:predicted nuclease of predicted toxin-antitoxin system